MPLCGEGDVALRQHIIDDEGFLARVMDYYKNKVAIVTGGASGLGLELCRELGRRGAVVVPVDINQEGAQQVASDIVGEGGKAHFAYLDVTLYKNAEILIREITSKYGRLDLLFNNAGTAIQGETRDLAVRDWRRVIDVNLWGVIHGAIAAYNAMEKQGGGQIVNISSLAGLIPVPKEIPYSTGKWAIVGFSSALRAEGCDLGIKVNLVCPGIMETPIHEMSQVVNVDRKRSSKIMTAPYRLSPAKAAKIVLRGVERDKAMIIFPFYARFIWWLYRFSPALFQVVSRKIIRDFRKVRLA